MCTKSNLLVWRCIFWYLRNQICLMSLTGENLWQLNGDEVIRKDNLSGGSYRNNQIAAPTCNHPGDATAFHNFCTQVSIIMQDAEQWSIKSMSTAYSWDVLYTSVQPPFSISIMTLVSFKIAHLSGRLHKHSTVTEKKNEGKFKNLITEHHQLSKLLVDHHSGI